MTPTIAFRSPTVTTLDTSLVAASRLRTSFVGTSGYALAYGSQVSGSAASDSDLDLLFIGPPLSADQLERLVRAVVDLHHDHGLRLDTEVAYEVKLHTTAAEVDAALALRGFSVSPTGELHVPPLVVAPWFLNSVPFKLRLILNALTTPHQFLGGDLDEYRRNCSNAGRALALVALSLLDRAFTVAEAVAAVVNSPTGATEEDFLGYSDGPALHATVQGGLARMTAEHAVRTDDGLRFEQDRDVRRRLVVAQVLGHDTDRGR